MNDNELLAAIRGLTYEENGTTKLACGTAHDFAGKDAAILKEIGRLCNDHDIRITRCQLGCFE